jgi:plasmid stabilization system protein ParE
MPNKIFWTQQARQDLRAIREFIARNAPSTAAAFVRRVRASVNRLYDFPQSGQVVAELGREDLREILQGNYRIIYRYENQKVDILTVYHSARLLDWSDF